MKSLKDVDGYEDDIAARIYLEAAWTWYMTDHEKGCLTLGTRREKALLDPDSWWSKRVLQEWERADEEARSFLEGGLAAFEQKIRDRVLNKFQDGTLVINRCPRCQRVVRSPLARQCLWCSHDWHG